MADKKRRRSLRNVFKRPDTPPDTPSLPSGPPSPVEKRVEFFAGSPATSESSSPRIRPRTLQKANRTSVFGSLRSLHSLDEDEKVTLTRSDSKSSSMYEDGFYTGRAFLGDSVLHHGEVQTAGSTMFRKRNHYLVLTDSHLVRFKNLSKANEVFPSLIPMFSKPAMARHSTSSMGSLSDLQLTSSNEITQVVPLEQIVGVHKAEDGRSSYMVEVSFLDKHDCRSSALQMQFAENREAESWIRAIRKVCSGMPKVLDHAIHRNTLDYISRILESSRDYDPLHFRIFKIVQLSFVRTIGKSVPDDTAKTNSSICYLAVGVNKVHFIPLPRVSKRSSSTSLAEYEAPISMGIVNLSLVKVQECEHLSELVFKHPQGIMWNISLASFQANEVVLWLRFTSEYNRPEWIIQPFVFDVPSQLDDQMDPPAYPAEEFNCFDRTLMAYCSAYNVDVSRITYTVDLECEDAPRFQLLRPAMAAAYSDMELLAVMRALRYNECFTSISFANIDLNPLRGLSEMPEADIDCQSTRSGMSLALPGHDGLSVLSREIRALALKSRRLRRLDFTSSIPVSTRIGDNRQGCGIPVALAPLTKKSLTNVDWIVLNGVQLAEEDLDHLVDAASERLSHLRALEIGDCGLSVHDVDVLLSALSVHDHTLEVINVSAAQGRFSPEIFQRAIGPFAHIRQLNLARCQKTAGTEPLIAPEILLGWRLESLNLSQTTLNEQTIEALRVYLASPMSDTMKELQLHQCGLTGHDLAALLRSMTRIAGIARDMHFNASENRLNIGSTAVAKAIAEGYSPISLSIRMMDFEKEHHFRELVEALAINTTLRSLDLSRATLPYDASEETCEALKEMFAVNKTLEELDISGEHTHLDAARFGIGLNIALPGLAHNQILKRLKIEYQSLGLQGANTLAGVLETNTALLEIHCEHNDINLQSFSVLVNAIRRNKTLLFLPPLLSDKAKSMEKVEEEFEKADKVEDKDRPSPKPHTLIKGISALSHIATPKLSHSHHHRKTSSIASNISFTDQDLTAMLGALEEKWQIQLSRLQQYLARNYNIATGTLQPDGDELGFNYLGLSDMDISNDGRPATADSLGKILAKVKLDRTPTVERTGILDSWNADKRTTERETEVPASPEGVFHFAHD